MCRNVRWTGSFITIPRNALAIVIVEAAEAATVGVAALGGDGLPPKVCGGGQVVDARKQARNKGSAVGLRVLRIPATHLHAAQGDACWR